MAVKVRRAAPPVILAAALVLATLVLSVSMPAFAHGGEQRPAATTSAQSADQTGAPGPDELQWPTAQDPGMPSMAGHGDRPTTFTGRLVRWLGAWHPAAVHFPIGILLTVAFLELAAAVRRKPIYNANGKILLALGTLSAFVAVPLGWISAGLPAGDDEFALTVHRWIGTALPFVFVLLWWLKQPAEQAAVRKTPPYYEALLAAAVLVVLAQSYFGAVVTHGAEHLAF